VFVKLILDKVTLDHVIHKNKMDLSALELAEDFGYESTVSLLLEKLEEK
jgi:hypothetical protein